MKLYAGFNWGVCLLTLIYLYVPLIHHPDRLGREITHAVKLFENSTSFYMLVAFILVIPLLFYGITKALIWMINIETHQILKKHEFYSGILKKCAPGISRKELGVRMEAFTMDFETSKRLKQIRNEEKAYKRKLKNLNKERNKIMSSGQ